jgi:hypothetical protein
MRTIEGTAADWREVAPGEWRHKDDNGSGIAILVFEGTFAEAFAAHSRGAPSAPLATIVPYGEFRLRWTWSELSALFDARKTHWQVDDFVSLAAAQGNVNLSGDTAAAAKALFVSLGVLAEERAEAIFAE